MIIKFYLNLSKHTCNFTHFPLIISSNLLDHKKLPLPPSLYPSLIHSRNYSLISLLTHSLGHSLLCHLSFLSSPEGVPPDGIPKQVIVSTALALTVIYYILAIAGIIFALVCVGFNIIFRNRKYVHCMIVGYIAHDCLMNQSDDHVTTRSLSCDTNTINACHDSGASELLWPLRPWPYHFFGRRLTT